MLPETLTHEGRVRDNYRLENGAAPRERPAPGTGGVAPMQVVGYVRVSSDEQALSGAGLEAQRQAIVAECKRRGWQPAR